MTQIGLTHFLAVAAILFSLGFFTVVTRKNAVGILMGVELMLNAANLNFVAFSRYGDVAKEISINTAKVRSNQAAEYTIPRLFYAPSGPAVGCASV